MAAAVEIHPADITDRIYVHGKTAKHRQQRYVEIIPALKDWFATAPPTVRTKFTLVGA